MPRRWIDPWFPVEHESQRALLQDEIRRELSEQHVLWRVPFAVVATRDDQDDIVLDMPGGKIAEVHLTWSKREADDPRWPRTEIYDTFDAWCDKRMKGCR